MAETNPVASVAMLKPHMEDWDWERKLDYLETAGLPIPGVQVKIVDAQARTVVDTVASGPWFYAQLPPGEYVVTATSEGKSLTQRVAIKGNGWRGWVFRFEPPRAA